MNYFVQAGIVLVAWVLNILLAFIFKSYTKGNAQVFEQKIVDNGRNILFFGFLGVGGLFLCDIMVGWITYVILGIWVIIVLFGIVPLFIALLSTIALMFDSSDNGLMNTGRLSSWIFILSMLVENSLMVYILYKMFIIVF